MHDELTAIERQNMLEEINNLKAMFKDMESDFEKCAKGISPCFFCANDDTCNCSDSKHCNFVWKTHN